MPTRLTASSSRLSNGDSRDSAIDLTTSRSPSPYPLLVKVPNTAASTSHKRARSAQDSQPDVAANSSRPFKVVIKPLKPDPASKRKQNTLLPKASGAKIYPPPSPTKYPRRIVEQIHLSSPVPATSTYLYKDQLEAPEETDSASEESEAVPILRSPRKSVKAQGKERAKEEKSLARVDRNGSLVLSPPREATFTARQYFVPPSPDSPKASTSYIEDSDSDYAPRKRRRSPGIEVIIPKLTVPAATTEKRKRGRPKKVRLPEPDGKRLDGRVYKPRGPRVLQSLEKPFHRGVWRTGRAPPDEVAAQFSVDISPPPPVAKKLIIKFKNPSPPNTLAKAAEAEPCPEFAFDSTAPPAVDQGSNDPFLTFEPVDFQQDAEEQEWFEPLQEKYTPPLSASLQTEFKDESLLPSQDDWFDDTAPAWLDRSTQARQPEVEPTVETPQLMPDEGGEEDFEAVNTPNSVDGLVGMEELFGLPEVMKDEGWFGLDLGWQE